MTAFAPDWDAVLTIVRDVYEHLPFNELLGLKVDHLEAERAGFKPESVTVKTRSRAHAHPGSAPIQVHMVGDKDSGRLLGVQMVGREGAAHRINAPAVALHAKMTVAAFSQADLAYAPPFGPVWDPLLTAANQLMKKL